MRRRWLLILALVVLAAWTAAAFIATADKKYEAEADILVTPFADSTGAFEGITLFRDPTSSIYAAGRIMTTPATTDAVIERLDLGVSREDLLDSGEDQAAGAERHRLDHRGGGITGGCGPACEHVRRRLHRATKTEFQSQLNARIDQVEAQLDALGSAGTDEQQLTLQEKLATLKTSVGAADPTIQLLSEAVPPDSPFLAAAGADDGRRHPRRAASRRGRSALLATLDPRMSSEDELLRHLPVLARIPRARKGGALVPSREGSLPADLWEGYRTCAPTWRR